MPFGTITLNDGNKVPEVAFGTGTALYRQDATKEVVQALRAGFVHIDCAQMYQNEDSIARAIQETRVSRSDLFVTTKFGGGVVREEFEKSLKALAMPYVDLYLIHSPKIANGDIPGCWKALEKIQTDGLAKSIGVSNFEVEDLKVLLKDAKVKPAMNQIKFHPYNHKQNTELLEFCAKEGIITEAYGPLTPITKQPGGPVDEPVHKAAKRLGATPAQVLMLWIKAKGAVVVTTTSKEERLQEYLRAGDLGELTKEEVDAIDGAGAKLEIK